MAVVRSLGIGEGRKSAGMLTYRVVRGRTIASKRIVQNLSNTSAQANQRANFGDAAKAMLLSLAWIDNAFEKSKYGSRRNNFAKLNKRFISMNTGVDEFLNGDYSAFKYWAYAFEGVASDGAAVLRPAISTVASGTAGGVVVSPGEQYSAGWLSELYEGAPFLYKDVIFTMPSPIDISRLSLRLVKLTDKKGIVVKEIDLATTSSDGVKVTKSNDLVSSISFEIPADEDPTEGQSIWIPVLSVDKRIVTCGYAMLSPSTRGGV